MSARAEHASRLLPLRQSNRGPVPSNKLADPNNGEPLDPVHQASVAKSITVIHSLIEEIGALCPTLPESVPKAAPKGEIWRILNSV
ncbi:hypothetical protein B0H19DRAFT_1027512 [Mycena capillaripes]|nr:hypothetical protein B0H19DRAFT_1027512 [Mycena capillaripes]